MEKREYYENREYLEEKEKSKIGETWNKKRWGNTCKSRKCSISREHRWNNENIGIIHDNGNIGKKGWIGNLGNKGSRDKLE